MFRTTDIVLIGAMVAAASFTYKTKHDAEDRQVAIYKIEQQIRFEEDTLNLLKADWSLATQPARLQRLVSAYQSDLGIEPTDPKQVISLDELPERRLTIEDLMGADAVAEGARGADRIVTGSVVR